MRSIFSALAFCLTLAGISALGSASVGPAFAADTGNDPEAEKFISSLADQALGVLERPDVTLDEKKRAFGEIVLNNADIQQIGYFTLGKYYRVATPDQLAEFSKLYEQYTRNFYEARLSSYSGEKIKVVGSSKKETKSGGQFAIVNTAFMLNGNSELSVNWLLEKLDGTYVIRDLEVAGISLASEQRSQFTSIIANNGGQFQALLTRLGDVVAQGGSFDLESQIQSN